MNQPAGQNSPQPASQIRPPGWGYLATVAVLLTTIVVLLAVLAMRERLRRIDAEIQFQQQARTIEGLQTFLSRALSEQAQSVAEPFRREDLPTDEVTLDGQPRTLLRLSAAAGRRFGLQPGDLVQVTEEMPTTAPETPQDAEDSVDADATAR